MSLWQVADGELSSSTPKLPPSEGGVCFCACASETESWPKGPMLHLSLPSHALPLAPSHHPADAGSKGGVYGPHEATGDVRLASEKVAPERLGTTMALCPPTPRSPSLSPAISSSQPDGASDTTVARMCTGTCSRVVAAALWPMALLAIVANILLAFPDWKTEYVHDWGQRLTPEVMYLGGLIGGGIMMLLSVVSAAVGVMGALYALTIAMLGLVHGPFCQYHNGTLLAWGRPFEHHEEPSSQNSYLLNPSLWDTCVDPPGVTRFNVILFSLMGCASVVELILCFTQIFNGLFGCICGTCKEDKENGKRAPQTYN